MPTGNPRTRPKPYVMPQFCKACGRCIPACPKDCIHMGTEYAFVTYDRSELLHDLLSFKGMDRGARIRIGCCAQRCPVDVAGVLPGRTERDHETAGG